jgi:gluconolactonase
VLIDGIAQPEGPAVLDDGSVVFVESLLSRVLRWSEDLGCQELSFTGGGPNACKVGDDGRVYVTQNGGSVPGWESVDIRPPSIQRISRDGECEELFTALLGMTLRRPNDLAFDQDGSLWFSDPPDWSPGAPAGVGRVFKVAPGGAAELTVEQPLSFPNGVATHPSGSIIWVDSYGRGIYRHETTGSELITVLPPGHTPDGLDVDVEGNLWVASIQSGGLDVVAPSGEIIDFLPVGGYPLNCTFRGTDIVVTTADPHDRSAGRLVSIDVGIAGWPVPRGHLDI